MNENYQALMADHVALKKASRAQQAQPAVQPLGKPHLCGLVGLDIGLCSDCAGIRAVQKHL